jgi:glutamate synthase domain-containing protein 2
MRHNLYLGFGVVLLAILALLLSVHANILWFWGFIGVLTFITLHDFTQKKHSILRNYPVLGHMRFILEFFRPEIQQYFIANNRSETPFNRETRNVIYSRSKNLDDTVGFGTKFIITEEGYEWVLHSLAPKPIGADARVTIGSNQCKQKYNASMLNISAMSYGSLSSNAIVALNLGAKQGNFAHNTGEGGLTSYHQQGGDIIMQIGTGYFGVRTAEGNFSEELFQQKANLDAIKMIEIKLSQGAKPSHGGVLPAKKLTAEIAKIRGVPLGKDVLSPASHSAFDSPESMCMFIQKLRELSNYKPIGFKLCLGKKSDFIAICKAIIKTEIYPDFITIDGAEGGTGAAPMEYSNHIGTALKDGLIFVHNSLVGFGLRDKIKIICSGKIATGFDMIRYIALGADLCNSARAMMMALGCIQSRECNKNTCPVGVATQNKRLIRGLDINNKKNRVENFHNNTIKSFLEIIGAMGLNSACELQPQMVFQRIDANTVKSYDQIYDYIETASLLKQATVPEQFKACWQYASADKF